MKKNLPLCGAYPFVGYCSSFTFAKISRGAGADRHAPRSPSTTPPTTAESKTLNGRFHGFMPFISPRSRGRAAACLCILVGIGLCASPCGLSAPLAAASVIVPVGASCMWARHSDLASDSPSRPKRVEALFKKPCPSARGAAAAGAPPSSDLTDSWSRTSREGFLGIEGTCFAVGSSDLTDSWNRTSREGFLGIDGTCFAVGSWRGAVAVDGSDGG